MYTLRPEWSPTLIIVQALLVFKAEGRSIHQVRLHAIGDCRLHATVKTVMELFRGETVPVYRLLDSLVQKWVEILVAVLIDFFLAKS